MVSGAGIQVRSGPSDAMPMPVIATAGRPPASPIASAVLPAPSGALPPAHATFDGAGRPVPARSIDVAPVGSIRHSRGDVAKRPEMTQKPLSNQFPHETSRPATNTSPPAVKASVTRASQPTAGWNATAARQSCPSTLVHARAPAFDGPLTLPTTTNPEAPRATSTSDTSWDRRP